METLFLVLFFAVFAGAMIVDAVKPAILEALPPLVRDAMEPASSALPVAPAGANANADALETLESELRRVREERDFYRDLAEGPDEPDEVATTPGPTSEANSRLGACAVLSMASTVMEFL